MTGFAFCGSFCTHKYALEQMRALIQSGREILPIMSETVYSTDTRFGAAKSLIDEVEALCGRSVVHTVVGAEPLGPTIPLEAMVICPCTGNTLAKMSCGITDTAVTMAAKAHLRSDRPLVIALATNDALSANLKNIGQMLTKKPHSLVADFSLVMPVLEAAEQGKQYQRIFK